MSKERGHSGPRTLWTFQAKLLPATLLYPDFPPDCSLHTPYQLHKQGLLTRPSEASQARVGGRRNSAMLGRACVLLRWHRHTDTEAGPLPL